MVTERWIKKLDYVFQKFVLRSNGVTYLEPRLYIMYEDYLAGELGNALVRQLMSREPVTPGRLVSEGEGVLCPPVSPVFVVDCVDKALLCRLELTVRSSEPVELLEPNTSKAPADAADQCQVQVDRR